MKDRSINRTARKVKTSRDIEEQKTVMLEDRNMNVGLRGCIKTSKGPWVVRRTTKNGSTITKFRYPSDKERLNNKQRERNRRAVAHNIFAGLRAHGNYQLSKNADTNDLLKALCEEAGWHVEEDGTVHRKTSQMKVPSWKDLNSSPICTPNQFEGEDYCDCEDNIDSMSAGDFQPKNSLSLDISGGYDSDLKLSLSPPFTHISGGYDFDLKLSLSPRLHISQDRYKQI